ncbi:hypothetical protein [Sphingomonas solaris]|uniref:hypothetical protein n=1 Tax=Alterirhizorhabdus solaris TaxID=2529389 RepID=UPI001396ADCC|nr:hypothetical protein [Sphingomonas solaris]
MATIDVIMKRQLMCLVSVLTLFATAPSTALAHEQKVIYSGDGWKLRVTEDHAEYTIRSKLYHERWTGKLISMGSVSGEIRRLEGVLSRTYVVAGCAETQDLPIRLELQEKSCEIGSGFSQPITAIITFDTEDEPHPQKNGCGRKMPPSAISTGS